jgi:hypothetical protein
MRRGILNLAFVAVALLSGARSASAATAPALRPPAVPLVTSDPYLSVWSFNDKLTDADTKHWTGRPHTIRSLVRIDGKAYRIAGAEPSDVPALPQTRVTVLPTRTIYTFVGAGVTLTLTFTTPLLPDDLDVLARPVTYVTWQAAPADGVPHDVSVMLAVGGDLAVNTPGESVVAKRQMFGNLNALVIGSETQPVLRSKGDDHRINWGYLYLTAPDAAGAAIGGARMLGESFVASGKLPAKDEQRFPRAVSDGLPSAAVALNLGTVTDAKPVSRHAIVAYDDLFSIQYMRKDLRPYWRRNGMDAGKLLQAAAADYAPLATRCQAFDEALMADARKLGGEEYARICALAHRQSIAAQKVVADENKQPLSFSKENFSNGCIATVDVFYPQLPHFLLMSPALAKATVVPLLDYSLSKRFKFDFAPHDLGTYPQANGQAYGGGERTEENQMPVEETGNMLILVGAISRIDGNADFATKYWKVLAKWAKYLEVKGFDPENQLCTDDFAGHLAHNTNLSIKAIMGLGSYAMMCQMRGDADEAARVRKIAEEYAARWVKEADDGDHYRLTFDRSGTWSQKYNLVWDKLLGLNLFPKEVAQKEIAFYLSKQNKYGLPLDSRSQYTKLDWIVWTATLADRQDDFEALVKPIHTFLHESPSRVPMTDWYFTDKGTQSGFQARPVVGGVFIRFLADESLWKQWAGRAQKVEGNWAPMPIPPTIEVVESASKSEGVMWRYTTQRPVFGWFKPDFNDKTWSEGPGGFGTSGTPNTVVRTEWNTRDIWARRQLTVPESADVTTLKLYVHHDEDAEIYVNGVLAARTVGYTTDYDVIDILPAARSALKPGKNLVAVHCHQTNGGQYIDVGLARLKK